jgi:Nucleoside-diphosphate-sugar epimerases
MDDMFWRDRNVFVTGCTGLLGSWLTGFLIERKANVVGLIRDSVPRSNLYGQHLNEIINVIRGNVEDYMLMERILNEYEIDTVFHLAAQTIVTIANRNPLSTFEANIKGTWNILEACRKSPTVTRIVAASSDKAYGDQLKLPYDEQTPLEGRHPYDVSKSCSDLICRAYYETYGLPICVTRCGNFYGGGDLNFNRIVPGTIRSIIKGEAPVIRGDGKSIRDYFYIEDGAMAYMTLAEKMENQRVQGEAFNFSNELQISVLDMVNLIIEKMGSKLKPVVMNNASNEIVHQSLSAKKAHEMLDWRPCYALDDSLIKTIEWYKNFFEYLDYNSENNRLTQRLYQKTEEHFTVDESL